MQTSKACVCYFLLFHQMKALQKLFISSKMLSLFLKYSNICIFPSFPHFPDSLFDNSLLKYPLSLKNNFLHTIATLGYWPKLKSGLGLVFDVPSAWFFHSCMIFSCLLLYRLTKLQCHTFCPSQYIEQNVLLSFDLDNWWRHKLLDLSSIIL